MTPRPISLIPDPLAAREAAIGDLTRAVISLGAQALDKGQPAVEYARRRWGGDRNVEGLIARAATMPSMTTDGPTQVMTAFLGVLAPVSAGAALLARGIQLNFNNAAQIGVLSISLAPADFVGESRPIPVVASQTSVGATLKPHKIAVITTLTSEMIYSGNAEVIIKQALIESAGPALDRALLSATAAGSDRPAGLLAGVAPLTPAAATGNKGEVIVDDVQALIAAIAPYAGDNNIVLIGSPDVVTALRLRLFNSVTWPILMSASLPARTVIAIVTSAIVSAVDGAPQIDASQQAELHRDSAPSEIVDIGGVKAAPVGSVFQTDQVALRMRWPITWALRAPAVAWMQSVNW